MKYLIQKFLGQFGYTLRRTSKLKPFVPFVRNFSFPEASFRMWIANPDDVTWYEDTWNKRGEYRALHRFAKSGDRVLEIGSHHGLTALCLANFVGPSGSVVGVEAHPQNCMIAQSQLALNPSLKNLQFVHAACSDTPGVARIIPSHNSCVTAQMDGDTIEVPALTGDLLDEKYGPFDMVKVDVEGFELEVLRGCSKILSRTPKLALELHYDALRERGHSLDDIYRLIDLSRYEGLIALRPDDGTILEFDLSKVPKEYSSNLFLQKKKMMPRPAT